MECLGCQPSKIGKCQNTKGNITQTPTPPSDPILSTSFSANDSSCCSSMNTSSMVSPVRTTPVVASSTPPSATNSPDIALPNYQAICCSSFLLGYS